MSNYGAFNEDPPVPTGPDGEEEEERAGAQVIDLDALLKIVDAKLERRRQEMAVEAATPVPVCSICRRPEEAGKPHRHTCE